MFFQCAKIHPNGLVLGISLLCSDLIISFSLPCFTSSQTSFHTLAQSFSNPPLLHSRFLGSDIISYTNILKSLAEDLFGQVADIGNTRLPFCQGSNNQHLPQVPHLTSTHTECCPFLQKQGILPLLIQIFKFFGLGYSQ